MSITTHVLDTARGKPAEGIAIALERRRDDGTFELMGRGATDADGRLRTLVGPDQTLVRGVYRITFDVGAYHERQAATGFYPEVSVTFDVVDPTQHFHVPLLLSPWGYSTYRGS
jgi:5-hydroxyisourate hydrolase